MECPYTQRVWIALTEKALRFEFNYLPMRHVSELRLVTPNERPAWFLKLSPAGKVRWWCGLDDAVHYHIIITYVHLSL